MNSYEPRIRLFVEAPLKKGATVFLSAEQGHYLTHVMRQKAGEALSLFNGRDGEWLATLQPVSKKQVDAHVLEQRQPYAALPDILYVFAPLKAGRIDYIAQKATELGATALQPVITMRTIATRVNVERLRANAIEAAEQSERLDVPAIYPEIKLEKLLQHWDKERLLLYGDETGKGLAPHELFATLPQAGKHAVLVGPEGGFAPEELERLRNCSFAYAISLGPRILRADTAGLAALTCFQLWRGDWNK